jgi:hypothetical protein
MTEMYNAWLRIPALLAIMIEIAYITVELKYVTLVFTILNILNGFIQKG